MKRISILLATLALWTPLVLRAQDAATEERLNKLAGQIEDLKAGQDALRKQFETVMKEIDSVREQLGKPTGNYASQDDLKRVAKAVEEVDRKRVEDAERVKSELLKLQKAALGAAPSPKRTPTTPGGDNSSSPKTEGSDKGFEYVVKKGDTLSTIAQAYRDNNIKVTTDQILKANSGLKPEKMYIGQKIWIPAPK